MQIIINRITVVVDDHQLISRLKVISNFQTRDAKS
jgi:hypothetical protein